MTFEERDLVSDGRVDFTLLTTRYGMAGAREKFEELCVRILKTRHSDIKSIVPKTGDRGIDFFFTDFGGRMHVFQVKYFPNPPMSRTQWDQVSSSFRTANRYLGKKLSSWTLCLPCDLTNIDFERWDAWQARRRAGSKIEAFNIVTATDLRGILDSPSGAAVKADVLASLGLSAPGDLGPPLLIQLFPNASAQLHFRARHVPLVGYGFEIGRLKGFLHSGNRFSWWLMTGKAGAGKSRLALELCLDSKDAWDAGFLPEEFEFKKWRDWQPSRPTLIVVDYASVRVAEIRTMIAALYGRASPLRQPVRLLLLERDNEGDWWKELLGSGTSRLVGEASLYQEPIRLNGLTEQDLWTIVRHFLKKPRMPKLPRKNQVLKSLKEIDPLRRPLFAALAGDALGAGRDIRKWDANRLIRDILEREEQIFWNAAGVTVQYKNLLALATMDGGFPVADLKQFEEPKLAERVALPRLDTDPSHQFDAGVYGVMVGRDSHDYIAPLEPDLIGELFVLQQVAPRYSGDQSGLWITCLALIKNYSAVADFLSRAMDDFQNHAGLEEIMMAVRLFCQVVDNQIPEASQALRDETVRTLVLVWVNYLGRTRPDEARDDLSKLWRIADQYPAIIAMVAIGAEHVIEGYLALGNKGRAREVTLGLINQVGSKHGVVESTIRVMVGRAHVLGRDREIAVACDLFVEASEVMSLCTLPCLARDEFATAGLDLVRLCNDADDYQHGKAVFSALLRFTTTGLDDYLATRVGAAALLFLPYFWLTKRRKTWILCVDVLKDARAVIENPHFVGSVLTQGDPSIKILIEAFYRNLIDIELVLRKPGQFVSVPDWVSITDKLEAQPPSSVGLPRPGT